MPGRRDIDDLDDRVLGRDAAEERREERAEFLDHAAKRSAAEVATAEAQRARTIEWMMQTNRETIVAEYRRAGVEPPKKADGTPNLVCGLELLLQLGWTIQDLPDGRVLVAPAPPPAWTGHRDADSLPEK